MPSIKPSKARAGKEMFIDAELKDARLLGEQLQTFEDRLTGLLGGKSERKLNILAKTQINNSMAVQFDDKSNNAKLLRVNCDLTVTVFTREEPDISVATYQSQYVGYFEISRSQNVKRNDPIVTAAVATYAKQVNWLATRRADGALAATGVANLRLNVPAIGVQTSDLIPEESDAVSGH